MLRKKVRVHRVRFELTAKGRKSGDRSVMGLHFPDAKLSFPEGYVVNYLRKKKTPATATEIRRGASLGDAEMSYTNYILGGLRKMGLVKVI